MELDERRLRLTKIEADLDHIWAVKKGGKSDKEDDDIDKEIEDLEQEKKKTKVKVEKWEKKCDKLKDDWEAQKTARQLKKKEAIYEMWKRRKKVATSLWKVFKDDKLAKVEKEMDEWFEEKKEYLEMSQEEKTNLEVTFSSLHLLSYIQKFVVSSVF